MFTVAPTHQRCNAYDRLVGYAASAIDAQWPALLTHSAKTYHRLGRAKRHPGKPLLAIATLNPQERLYHFAGLAPSRQISSSVS